MYYRKLGYTGLDVSVIGFGTWQLGGGRWQAMSDEDSIQLLRQALNIGVNIYDVAVVYGQYADDKGYLQSRSQELLGKAFKTQRNRVIYSVKVGQFDEYSHRHNYEPQRIVSQIQESLKRLHTDYIDICLIHAPSINAVTDGKAITVLKTLQALGIIKFIGYSFEAEPEHVSAALSQNIDVIMLQYNLLDTECKDVIEQARLHGIGILVGGPYKRGYLTGRYSSINDLPMTENYWDYNVNLNPGKVKATLNSVNSLVQLHGSPVQLRQAAIDHILSKEAVASCVVGHMNITDLVENNDLSNNFYNKEKNDSLTIEEEILFKE